MRMTGAVELGHSCSTEPNAVHPHRVVPCLSHLVVLVVNTADVLLLGAQRQDRLCVQQLRGDSLRERDGSRSVQAERTIRRMAALHGRAKESEEEAAELHQCGPCLCRGVLCAECPFCTNRMQVDVQSGR